MGISTSILPVYRVIRTIMAAQPAAKDGGKAINTPNDARIQSLNLKISSLQRSVSAWNSGYIVLLVVALGIGALTVGAQWKTVSIAKQLGVAQSQLRARKIAKRN
jgi:hypothetical protein